MDEFEHIASLLAPAYEGATGTALMVCLFTGERPPQGCEPMPRVPAPTLGALLDRTFPEQYAAALKLNPEVHDGAVLAGRVNRWEAYQVQGWSYRLFPGPVGTLRFENRGSAFHSSLAMSGQVGVDAIILFARGELTIFRSGELASAGSIGTRSDE
jgi:hypothetical protein